ncbi:MAG: phosphoribosylglycinamide formyltransferase [Vicinamibacterales bacterium]
MLTPLRAVVLCSHRAPGLLHLLNADPARGRTYDIVACVTSEPTFAEEVRVERRGVPTRSHDIHAFYEERHAPVARANDVRASFDARTAKVVKSFSPDLVLLAGYLYVLTEPMLSAFPRRILNLHFADLMLRTPDGQPGFPGIRAVRDALVAGCGETRATVHMVDAVVDGGAPLVRSWPFPVSPMVDEARSWTAGDILRAYAFAHEQWMMRSCAGPLWSATLRLLAGGAIDLDAVAASPAESVVPWELGRRGALVPPMAAQAMAAR